MDPITNPYSPGAGTPPPELAGRDQLRENVRIMLERIRIGNSAKSVIVVGLRGVGKTVLLEQMKRDAEISGVHTIHIEAPENRSLPAMLAPQLRLALLRLQSVEKIKEVTIRCLRGLAGFVKSLKVTFNDIEVGIDYDPEPGFADNGDLEIDLTTLFEEIGQTIKQAEIVLAIFIDELQYVRENELAALITALHRCAQQKLPICIVGAGLPQLRGRAGNAKSYAERLFDYPFIGQLSEDDARQALERPASTLGVEFASDAMDAIIQETSGYPYFLQEWGKHAWASATSSPITLADVSCASLQALATLDESFFRVRFDRLTPMEKRYLRAMAELGQGPHRSGDIANVLNRAVNSLGPTRASLLGKGMIWSPNHGDTAFTVPLFDQFIKRIMPDSKNNDFQ